MKLHLFNPENDLALAAEASGIRNYTPPKGALAVGYRGALLPLWWAGEEDCVLLPPRLSPEEYGRYLSEAEEMKESYGLKGRIATPEELKASGEFREAVPVPWGWSRYARHRFEEAGTATALLPDDDQLALFSNLSHRRNTITLNSDLIRQSFQTKGSVNIVLPPPPLEIRSVYELNQIVPQKYDQVMVKLPWSCSSRGLLRLSAREVALYTSRLRGMLRRQGSVMVEKYLSHPSSSSESGPADFAALFEADDNGMVRFRAWSLFKTDSNGRYEGNIVASQKELKERIPLSGNEKDWIAAALEMALNRLIDRRYRGWMGVDMMIWDVGEGGHTGVAPCLELNLRHTMGVAAYLIANSSTFPSPMVLNATDRGIILKPER